MAAAPPKWKVCLAVIEGNSRQAADRARPFLARPQASHPIDSRRVGTTRYRLPRTRVKCVVKSRARGYEDQRIPAGCAEFVRAKRARQGCGISERALAKPCSHKERLCSRGCRLEQTSPSGRQHPRFPHPHKQLTPSYAPERRQRSLFGRDTQARERVKFMPWLLYPFVLRRRGNTGTFMLGG